MPGSSSQRHRTSRGGKTGGRSTGNNRQPHHPGRKRRRYSRLPSLLILLTVIPLLLIFGVRFAQNTGPSLPEEAEEMPPQERQMPAYVVSSATICSTGDLLMHEPIFGGGYLAECYGDGNYDFSSLFQYLKPYVEQYDLAAANLETTLRGPELPYQGYPAFNTPDALIPALRSAGFDMLLTANNHCNDTGTQGIQRTLEMIRSRSLTALGTRKDSREPEYYLADLNGIKVGMLCYTYEDSQDPGRITLNGNPLQAEDLVCTFPLYGGEQAREGFYQRVSQNLEQLQSQGADMTVMYLHWGEEYHLLPSEDQKNMAQRLCDLGVDVIIGGHPHVAQPIELLESRQDPDHKTVCLYSMGNAVSNQRYGTIDAIKTAHTEDGMLFTCTFQKYSDGSTCIADVMVIPTWVNMFGNENGHREYNILPLDNSTRQQWKQQFHLTDQSLEAAWNSYERTMDIVGGGLGETNRWISRQNNSRDMSSLPAA